MLTGVDPLVRKAREFATRMHRRIDHRRKYTNQPYDTHLKAVAQRVAGVTGDPEMLAAAWLHDVVEDTEVTLEEVREAFGDVVAALVDELTDVSRPSDGNRAARKAIDRAHSARASPRAKTVKLADLLDNCRDIRRSDPGFARVFLNEAQALLPALREGDGRLHAKLTREVASGMRALGIATPAVSPEAAARRSEQSHAQRRAVRVFLDSVVALDLAEPLPRGDAGRSVPASRTVPSDARLRDVVHVLTRHASCAITQAGKVTGVVRREHLNSPVVRMWLFGLVTLAEMSIVAEIRARWPDGGWRAQLTPRRLEKAEALAAERRRQGKSVDLLDCLQFSDKAQVLVADREWRERLAFKSVASAQQSIRDIESLRNNLAHGQNIVQDDWVTIARLARNLEEFLEHFSGAVSPAPRPGS